MNREGGLSAIAAKGRRGDTELSHLTKGEVVVPKEFWALAPDLMYDIMDRISATGADPREIIAGMGRMNPDTGLEEFATAEEVTNLYQTYLGRAPESQDMINYHANSGQSLEQLTQNFINAPERASYVQGLYNTTLGRTAESDAAVQHHVQSGQSAAQLAQNFAGSAERNLQQSLGYVKPGEMYNWTGGPATRDDLNTSYMHSFGRPGEDAGLDYWSGKTQGLSGSDYMTRAIRAGALGDDILALRDPTLPAFGIERYNQAWDPKLDVNAGGFGYDASLDRWVAGAKKTPTKPPPVSTIPGAGQGYVPGSFTGNPNNASTIPDFNTDLGSPFDGPNWRNTVMAGTGYQGRRAYDFIKDKAGSGDSTLSSLQSDLGLNPGEIMAIYEEAVTFARENGLPIPLMPAVTNANKPYYNYGFNPGQKLFNREIDEENVVNPIAAYLKQIYALRDPVDEPVDEPTPMAEGGYAGGGLNKINADPVIHRYMKGGRGGQDDDIPARLSAGEYVFDADAVAALGDGNSEAGAAKLDQMRINLRKHKRAAPASKIPPKAKKPEQYLKGK